MGDDKAAASGCKVFIGGLNLSTTKESLKAHFEQWGEIIDAVVMRDPDSRRSRGFGFVTYNDSNCVDECLKECPHTVDGRKVDAKRAIPREETTSSNDSGSGTSPMHTKKVFLGGLSPDTTEEEIAQVLDTIGKVEEVVIQREKYTEKPRGFGFAIFVSHESVDRLCSKRYIKIKDRDVEVKKAISQEEMRRDGSRGRPSGGGGQTNYYRDNPYGGGGGRDAYQASYARGGSGGGGVYPMGGYDYRYPAAADYARADYTYGYPSYDRNAAAAAAAAYPYANTYNRSGYDMAAAYSMYGAAQAGMGATGYGQTPSNYGPARTYGTPAPVGTGGVVDYGKDRASGGGTPATRQAGYHPYRRN